LNSRREEISLAPGQSPSDNPTNNRRNNMKFKYSIKVLQLARKDRELELVRTYHHREKEKKETQEQINELTATIEILNAIAFALLIK
jgi:hypothetical protein